MVTLFNMWAPHFIHTKVPKYKSGRKPLNRYVVKNKEYILMNYTSDDSFYYCDYFTSAI